MPLTAQQRHALNYPTLLAVECMHPSFRTIAKQGYTLIITVNAGYE